MKENRTTEKLLYTVDEVAEMLGVSKHTVYVDLLKRPDFPSVRLSYRCIRIPKDELKRWIADQVQGGGIV